MNKLLVFLLLNSYYLESTLALDKIITLMGRKYPLVLWAEDTEKHLKEVIKNLCFMQ